MCVLSYIVHIIETMATESGAASVKCPKLSHFRSCTFKFENILTRLSFCLSYIPSLCWWGWTDHAWNAYVAHTCKCLLGSVGDLCGAFVSVCICICVLFSCVHMWVCLCIRAWRLQLGVRVCMSTILDSACVGCLSMCVLLSVQSSLHQQGAPFQFTHQPQR